MDLGAYCQIDRLDKIAIDNGISIPRLRGLRLMSEQKPSSPEEIQRQAASRGLWECIMLCDSDFHINSHWCEYSDRTRRLEVKYIKFNEDHNPEAIRWDRLHGKKRKLFKFALKRAAKRTHFQMETFNKYCGRPDVLYIHARIGGGNWSYYHKEVDTQPWFIERVDDAFDNTYCDIYAQIKPDIEE